MLANERTWRSEREIRDGLLEIHAAMKSCMERGFRQEGVLPGGLNVARRAPVLYRELNQQLPGEDSLSTLDWVNLYALAVNEENAAGGRVVTAPPTEQPASFRPSSGIIVISFLQPVKMESSSFC